MNLKRIRFIARGQVQGVGFRPFVFTLAGEYGLTGQVRNSPRGVIIEAQGEEAALESFARALEKRLPPLARLSGLTREECDPVPGEESFSIAPSTRGERHAVLVSPDMALCADCRKDMADPAGRRCRYPFTNCTNCGPRYTITRSIPYDRAATSMACFPLCADCRAEYENPLDRRFHAQPNACPVCGPRVWLVPGSRRNEEEEHAPAPSGKSNRHSPSGFHPEKTGQNREKDFSPSAVSGLAEKDGFPTDDAALRDLARFLCDGGIAAVKGLGGFHLACDACDEEAVAELRKRKMRPHKPFALMAFDLDEARLFAHIGPREEALLLSPEHPIVLCPLRNPDKPAIAAGISPDTDCVGLMLPCTPLHQTLLEHVRLERRAKEAARRPAALVMTSGNAANEPICLGNREALEKLAGLADMFLLHNRDILVRVDDSVVRPLPGHGTLFFRRARGYVPRPVGLIPGGLQAGSPQGGCSGATDSANPEDREQPCVIGAGADLKNTLCLTKGNDAFVGQHIGDMANLETSSFHREVCRHLASLLAVTPTAIVRDLHPDYNSGRVAEEYGAEAGIPVFRLQHHAAHAYAVLAEHRFAGRALALALDGTGFGGDGTLWGGEVLLVDTRGPEHHRLAHLAPLDLPGGEAAIREPWRIAHALLLRPGLARAGAEGKDAALPWLPEHAFTADQLPVMLEKRLNTPQSTSCGRLFDAVSALFGLGNTTTYEGQASIRLENAQRAGGPEPPHLPVNGLYPCPILPAQASEKGKGESGACLQLDTHALFAAAYADRAKKETPLWLLARRFHQSLAAGLVELAGHLAAAHGISHVGLSGGCLQNVTLALLLAEGLKRKGLTPLLHKDLPPGDACVSLGQAAWGRLLLRKH